MAFCISAGCEGLSSFYSELMKGFGAGTRLWELLDRKPEFPLNGQEAHTYTQSLTHTHTHTQDDITSEDFVRWPRSVGPNVETTTQQRK